MNILAIGAHPDDVEVGCAGYLIKYTRDGHELYLLVMTNGERGGEGGVRKEEQARAAERMGARDLIWGGYRDTELSPNMNRMVYDIESLIKKIKPDFIFVNYGNDTHQDHRSLAKATISATRYVRNVLFYEGPTTVNFSPLLFVDINKTIEEKIAILLTHNSQVAKTNIEGLSVVDVVRSTAIFRGIQGRVQYAEGYIPLRVFINM
jgi:LmbE family N-acetylglucosaminyl deacetylase